MRCLFLFFALSATVLGQDFVPSPSSVSRASRLTEGMVWNKWETEDFVLLSLDFNFGNKIRSRLDSERAEVCSSWGVAPVPLPVKCKLVCVPDKNVLKELFAIDTPRCEIRRDESLRPKEIAIWIDQASIPFLRGFLLSVSLCTSPPYTQRGVALLASSESEKGIISLTSPDFGKSISLATLRNASSSEIADLDGASAVVCLFVRREFGARAFSVAAAGTEPWIACGFADRKSFLETLGRYFVNLKEDLQSGKTPSSYLLP